MPRAQREGTLQRDVRTVWRTITVVAVVLLALGGMGVSAVVWYSNNNSRLTAIELRLANVEKGQVKNERTMEWHQRGHAPSAGK